LPATLRFVADDVVAVLRNEADQNARMLYALRTKVEREGR